MKQRFMGKNRSENDSGILIPEKWLRAKDLSIEEAVLLSEIQRLTTDEGCSESNAYFTKFMGLSQNQIAEFIDQLRNKGYIRVHYDTDANGQQYRIINLVR
ncbi:hypothetical protein ACLUWZ_06350 [Limosilactobacillus mucosae]|uniref:hypothetical protein n=1 Tax=Limosilactobacillus mucosae TaxID=97478 RepID=UPI00399401F7